MKTKKIYIVRHGQTDYNLRSIVQGKGIDASINEKGGGQAEAFYNYYKNEGFEVVFTSTLKRTTESVQSFIDDGLPQIKLAGLDEISWGVYEGVEAGYEDKLFFKEITQRWANGETSLAIDEGESPDEVAQRQQEVIELIKNSEESIILICMHGRALRVFLTQLLDLPIASMDQFEHRNLCLYQLNYTSGKFTLEKENDIRHLEPEEIKK
ncbi:MAG: histidine phosphatase family protein [Cyclobacteriaceae bacterium]|nr:histidine phosphatase family protein [Cyclobacteriaceae bacterium]